MRSSRNFREQKSVAAISKDDYIRRMDQQKTEREETKNRVMNLE